MSLLPLPSRPLPKRLKRFRDESIRFAGFFDRGTPSIALEWLGRR